MRPPTNEKVVLASLLALGGDLDLIDIEDIAVKADEIAPGRFRWRKYCHHINIQVIYKALKDGRARGRIRGGQASGWMLSEDGLQLALSYGPHFSVKYKDPTSRQDRSWALKERKRLMTEGAYQKLLVGEQENITVREALRFFMLDEYVTGDLRRARIDRLIRLFRDDECLSEAVQQIAGKVPQ